MRLLNRYLLLFVVITSLSSCNLYNPTFINSPVYEKEKELTLGVNIGSNQSINVSINPIEHLSIIANASSTGALSNDQPLVSTQNPNGINTPSYNVNLYQAELGIGYYYNLTDDIQHDLYIGGGIGKSGEELNIYIIESTTMSFFIQSSLSYKLDTKTRAIISSKFNRLSFSDYKATQIREANPILSPLVFNEKSFWVNQFGIGILSDLGPIELTLQAQLIARFNNNFEYDDFSPIAGFIGINFNLDEIINRKKSN